MRKLIPLLASVIVHSFTFGQSQKLNAAQEAIIDKYVKNGAYKFHYTLQEWDNYLQLALEADATIAQLWQLKALPYWKTRKYDLAVQCYDKAVQYDSATYLGRRGYLKCIFQKDYRAAIVDIELAESKFGYGFQNDHSYQFYIALCYLQLNEFNRAEQILQKDFDKTITKHGEKWIHFLDVFYMGIIQYELKRYDKAIFYFDKAVERYSNFSDAKYYKGLCLLQQGEIKQAEIIMRIAKYDAALGYTINEDDALYEMYPYKVNWNMAKWTIPNYKES